MSDIKSSLLFAMSMLCFTQVHALDQNSPAQPLEIVLKKQADAWDSAIIEKNRAAISANIADSFYMIDSDGIKEDKLSFINGITSADLVLDSIKVDEAAMRIYGETAIYNGVAIIRGSYKGNVFSSHIRFTDVYVKVGTNWQVVNVQTTRIRQ